MTFKYVDHQFLKIIAKDNDRTPSLYYSGNRFLRNFFWKRLVVVYSHLTQLFPQGGYSALDFGGGSGVMLPSLSSKFSKVICLDLETHDAVQVCNKYNLANVEVKMVDIRDIDYSQVKFQCIIAADVLEHFSSLEEPVEAIYSWLANDGYLFTSLPTENWLYVLLRKIFNMEKPWDHYHTAKDVEKFLCEYGFYPVKRSYLPLPWLTLFNITAWAKKV